MHSPKPEILQNLPQVSLCSVLFSSVSLWTTDRLAAYLIDFLILLNNSELNDKQNPGP